MTVATSLLTKVEAGEVLKVSRPTLERMIGRGELAVVRIGARGIRIPEDEVRRYIAERLQRRGQ